MLDSHKPPNNGPSLVCFARSSLGLLLSSVSGGFQGRAQPESTAGVGGGSRARFMFILLTSFPTLLQSKQKRNPGL